MGQWNLIVQGLATKKAGTTVSTDLTTGTNSTYSAGELNTVITAAGGTGLKTPYYYWLSTEYNTSNAWIYQYDGKANWGFKEVKYYVRPVFAF